MEIWFLFSEKEKRILQFLSDVSVIFLEISRNKFVNRKFLSEILARLKEIQKYLAEIILCIEKALATPELEQADLFKEEDSSS